MVRTVQLFEDPNVSMDQLSEFYKVEGSPHTYLMFVTTIDGIAVPLEPGQRGGSEIALRHLKDNPIATWYPRDKDLQGLLRKRSGKPVRAVVTGRGEVDLKHPVFNPENEEWQPVLFTTRKGEERLKDQAKQLGAHGHRALELTKTYRIGDTNIDLGKALGILRKDYNANLLDIQGGPILAGKVVKAMLVDEIRLTVSPQVMGDLNSEGKRRPGFVAGIHFGLEDSPIAELEAIGVSGSHVFLRYLMNYRN